MGKVDLEKLRKRHATRLQESEKQAASQPAQPEKPEQPEQPEQSGKSTQVDETIITNPERPSKSVKSKASEFLNFSQGIKVREAESSIMEIRNNTRKIIEILNNVSISGSSNGDIKPGTGVLYYNMDPDLIHDSYTINDLAELLDNVKLVNTKNGHIIDHSAASPSNRDASVFDEYYSDISNDEDPDDVDDI